MPRDLGKAKRSDITGHFPGEQAEYGSVFARFLEGAGQLKPLQDGTYLDGASGNGNGRSTEIPGRPPAGSNGDSSSTDTEIGRAPPPDNGAADTVFDSPNSFFSDDEAMFPEPMQSLMSDAAELEPVEFEPSADTLHPSNEPEALESVPDLTSPELDEPDDDPDATDILSRAQGMPPPATSSDTGLLEPEEVERVSDEDRISLDDLSAEDDETRSREDDGEEERITSKVDPRRDVDPRSHDPNAVVRDTVNFYNQTQNFKEQKAKGGFPTISPNVVNSTQPLDIKRDRQDTMPLQREPQPELVENEPDLISSAFADEAPLGLDDGPTFAPVPMGAQELSPADTVMPEEDTLRPDPVLSPDDGPALAPMSLEALDAEGDLDEIDKRETDKFRQEDRQPPQLPLPEGTDKVDKDRLARERAADEELKPIADEKVAGGKDTQRFYVADILARQAGPAEAAQHTGDTTSELQPAEQGLPEFASPSSETVADQTSEPTVDDRPTRIRRVDDPELPQPSEVNTDFKARALPTPSDRIVPELEDEPEETGDDTVDEEAAADFAEPAQEKITDKLEPPPEREHTTRRRPAVPRPASKPEPAVVSGDRVKRITDALSQRLKQERQETLRLIEEAEAVAVRLREASAQSRADLLAISERRAAATQPGGNGETRRSQPEPERPEVPLPVKDEFATEVLSEARVSAISDTTVSVPVSRRNPNRVPTRAIGEIVDDLKRAAVGKPSTLSELLAQVSHRADPVEEPDEQDDELDVLVAASARLRETVESAFEEDRVSRRAPAAPDVEEEYDYEPLRRDPEPPKPRAPQSTLSSDLDRLWKVLDSRRTATVVLPAADKARITRDDRDDAEVMEGWTQEMLWPTMAGIAVVTFALGALFVWVLSRM